MMAWKINREKAELALMNARKTWREVAKETYTSPATIVKALKGQGNTSPKTIGKIAAALGVDAAEIAESIEEPERKHII